MFRAILSLFFLLIPITSALEVTALGTTVLILAEGGTLEGELLNPDENNWKMYRIKMAEGLVLTLDAPLVERIQGREREALIQYNRDAPVTDNTVDNHHYWARWCREQQLPHQARIHWQQILELDPDHADARLVLGYTKTPNGWESRQEQRENRGLLQDGVRWKMAQQIEVETILSKQKEEAQHWLRTIRDLYRFPNRHAELLAIRDPAAFEPIRDILVDPRNPPSPMRKMLLRLLMQFPDDRSIQFVVGWSIRPDEPLEDIRKMCVEELLWHINDRPEIRPNMIAVYRHCLKPATDQAIINLAARVLGDIGGHEAVPELIDMLVLTRREVIQPQTPAYGFGPGGSGGISQPGRPITHTFREPNPVVLSALRKLTGVNFEFDQTAWRNWYRQSQRASFSVNLRRD
jgi:tetratricopeptide (TPR) repeat protein